MAYSTEDIERGLHHLALEAGNARAASKGCGIPEGTLKQWRTKAHRERYEVVRRSLEERIDRELAEDMVALTRQRLEACQLTIREYKDAVERGHTETAKDLAAADRNLAQALNIFQGQSRVIRALPTEIVEQRNADALIRKLVAVGVVQPAIEGTAVELPAPDSDT